MKWIDPWIDPRVCQVRASGARAYLSRKGWKEVPSANGGGSTFERTGEDGPVVWVPEREEGRDFTQRIIELITDVAEAEGRFAGAVLDEVLAGQGQDGTLPFSGQPATRPDTSDMDGSASDRHAFVSRAAAIERRRAL